MTKAFDPMTPLRDGRVAIVGYTKSREEVDYDDAGLEVWACNDLHRYIPRVDRHFDLHDKKSIESQSEHVAWLQSTKTPVYMFKPDTARYPTSVPFPHEGLIETFGNYFTNTISWQIALALVLGAKWIGVYGVDMAQGTEYAAQRPSCEYMLGIAKGAGIEVYVPETSDLLKCAAMYGLESDSAFRAKLVAREEELQERMNEATSARDNAIAAIYQLQGALETTRYFRTAWTQPEAKRDEPPVDADGGVPLLSEVGSHAES